MSYVAALRSMPATRLPLACAAALALFLLHPAVAAQPAMRWSFIAVPVLLALWHIVFVTRAARAGRRLGFDIVIRRAHWVQPISQGSVYVYWGWYWPEVYPYVPFLAAQLLFLYAFDTLLAWSRRDRYALGFGPFPIIFSTNLFMWFRPDWFYLQFAMVAAGSLGKEFVRWYRDGQRTHIINPSAFSLSLVSVVLLATNTTHLTWGIEIAATQQSPPYIYHWLFLIGFIGGTFFRVTTMTVSAATTLVLMGAAYTAYAGTYYFIDTSIPAAVFLGMHLLFTDPSTSPRTDLGRMMFGTLYGASVFALYVLLDAVGMPTHYDKLLAVPLMNACVQAIDRLAARNRRWADLGLPLSPARRNAVYLACWIPIFGVMLATHAVGKDHEGRTTEFWTRACEEGRPRGCSSLLVIHANRCEDGVAYSCNELGMLLTEGRAAPVDLVAAATRFDRACALGFAPGCANADIARSGRRNVSREAARASDLLRVMRETPGAPGAVAAAGGDARASLVEVCNAGDATACASVGIMYLEGRNGPPDYGKAALVLRKGCDAGQPVACANLGLMHRRGTGMPADEATARDLLTRACGMGVGEACRLVTGTP